MKKFIEKIKSLFNPDKDEDTVIDYLEKKQSGKEITEEERKEVLRAAIKITKESKSNSTED